MESDSYSRDERAARNEDVFRDVNERLEGLAKAFERIAGIESAFTCECADLHCLEHIALAVDEYEAVRRHPNRFVVLPGHVYADVEIVVSENDRFVVVDKTGVAAEIARAEDPRDEAGM